MAHSMALDPQMPAQLRAYVPSAANVQTVEDKAVTIQISKDRQIWLNEEKVTIDNLVGKIKALLENKAEDKRLVVIKADKMAYTRTVVRAMDAAMNGKALKLAISTDIDEGGGVYEEE